MRFGTLVLVSSSVVAILAACTQTRLVPVEEDVPDEGNEQQTGAAKEKQGDGATVDDDTCLGKAQLAFDDVECNACMSDDASCCQATIACFKDDAECAALHTCIQGCGGGAGGDPVTIFNAEVYPKLSPACASCHLAGTAGAPIFFGADAAATYALFKQKGYHLPNSLLVTKGLHNGPALTPDQRASIDKWVAAEATGGGDGGGGGGGNGGGGGGGNGMGDGGTGGGAACADTCKAQHPNAVAKWQTYNTCAAVTCKASCL